jgi:uncharacterized OsmC-like protein
MSFLGRTGSGHLVTMDGAPAGGGSNLAPRPMEMVLVGTAGCTAYDVVLILKRGRHAIEGCEVAVAAQRAEDDPKVFTRIDLKFTVRGRNLNRVRSLAPFNCPTTSTAPRPRCSARPPRSFTPSRSSTSESAPLDVVRRPRHHARGHSHGKPDRKREVGASVFRRRFRVAHFVVLHLRHDRA